MPGVKYAQHYMYFFEDICSQIGCSSSTIPNQPYVAVSSHECAQSRTTASDGSQVLGLMLSLPLPSFMHSNPRLLSTQLAKPVLPKLGRLPQPATWSFSFMHNQDRSSHLVYKHPMSSAPAHDCVHAMVMSRWL